MWHSLVARFVRDEEAAGSNPVIPTIMRSQRGRFCVLFFRVGSLQYFNFLDTLQTVKV